MAIQAAFTLTANEIYESLANMIISQEVFADNLGEHQTLVDKARVDGGLLGDTKLYYSTDVLESHAWGNDSEAANLLSLDRPADPEVQAIKLDIFRQIRLTLDNYMSKRAFADEGSFSQFNSVMLGWMRETKKVYDGSLYNVFIGTTVASGAAQSVQIATAAARGNASTEEEANRLEAEVIGEGIANLMVELGDYETKFNDYGHLRSYSDSAIQVVWNSAWVNKIKKIDTPTIFNREGLVDKLSEDVLPAKYFGTPNGSQVAALDNDGTYRSMIEKVYTVSDEPVHVFPGQLIPAGVVIAAGEGYTVDPLVICKIMVKLPPYMSAFEVGSTFWNARALCENHYLTFGHNSLAYLKNYPFITVKGTSGE